MADEKENVTRSADVEKLMIAMNRYAEGNFELANRDDYDDPVIADAFNSMVAKDTERNNRFLARINDAQLRIGDSSCLKTMLEEISTQQGAVDRLQEYRNSTNPSNRSLSEINSEFLGLAEQIREMFEPCASEMLAGIQRMDSEENLNLEELRAQYYYAYGRIQSMNVRINDMANDAEELFDIIDTQINMSTDFLANVDAITTSYKNLSADCLDTGRHLYRISRDIDNARNDMFRHFSRPTLHDRLRVYEVDHVTLGWRLYNNLVEFESLRLTQVNNPKSCKLGLWIEENRNNPTFANAEAFLALDSAHFKFHEKCIACYEAKQNFDRKLAVEKFNEIMEALVVFQEAMLQMHEYLREIGITDETDVWKFRG